MLGDLADPVTPETRLSELTDDGRTNSGGATSPGRGLLHSRMDKLVAGDTSDPTGP